MKRANTTKREGLRRTQILFEPALHRQILEIAKEENQSFSNVVREMLEEEVRARKRKQLEKAARALLHDYETNPELTAFNALDGEDFNA